MSRSREGVSVLRKAMAGEVDLSDFSIHTQVKARVIWRELSPEVQATSPTVAKWFETNNDRLLKHMREKHRRTKPQPKQVDYSFLYVNLSS